AERPRGFGALRGRPGRRQRRRWRRAPAHRRGRSVTPSPFPGVFAAAALAALALACRPGNGGGGGGGDAAGAGVRVETAVVRVGPFIEYVSALGTVSPRPGRYAELGAPAPTRVARIVAAAGQAVHEGDTLIVFERASFDAAAHTAEAALVSAQHAADRATRLVAAGVLPKKEADQ